MSNQNTIKNMLFVSELFSVKRLNVNGKLVLFQN